jgi:hypothetical protein
VAIDNSPALGDYYVPIAPLSDQEMASLRMGAESSGFGASLFVDQPSSAVQGGAYYGTGDAIHAKLTVPGVVGTINWLNGKLPFPKPDVNGKCNSYSAVSFMQDIESRCTAVVANLQNQCTTLLNPNFLISGLSVLTGQD